MGNDVYHIALVEDWENGLEAGFYTPKAYEHEGFIHASYPHQIQRVLNRYFTPYDRVVILKLRTDVLAERLVPEWVASQGQHYPHIFCPIQPDMVERTWILNERRTLPDEVK